MRSHSRGGIFTRVVPFRCSLLDRGRRESRAPTAPAAPCAMGSKRTHTDLTGTAETSRLSPRNGFTVYFVLSPVSGLYCHRCQPRTGRADRRQGRGARTTRLRRTPQRFRPARNPPDAAASIATRATLRDDRETSLWRRGLGGSVPQIRILVKRNIFHPRA